MHEGISFDEAFSRIGGKNFYQFLALVPLGLVLIQSSIIVSSIPIFLTIPGIKCQINGALVPCLEEEICSPGSHYIFDNKDIRTVVYEWYFLFRKLVCESHAYVYIIPAVFFIGISIGTFIFGNVAEKQGRVTALRWSASLSCLFEFIIFCSASAWFFTVSFLFLAISLSGCVFIPFVYTIEVINSQVRPLFIFFLMGFWAIGFESSYMLAYSFNSWRPMIIASLGVGLFGLLLLWNIVVESPRFMAFNKSRYTKVRKLMEHIANRNSKTMFDEQLQGESINEYSETAGKSHIGSPEGSANRSDDNIASNRSGAVAAPYEYMGGASNIMDREQELERGQNIGYVDFLKLESLRIKFAIMVWIWLSTSMAYHMYSNSKEMLDPDPTANSMIYLSAKIGGWAFGLLLSIFFRSKRNLIFSICFASATITLGALKDYTNIDPVYSFLASYTSTNYLLISLSIYTLEIFPTPARSLGMAIVSIVFWTSVTWTYVLFKYAPMQLAVGVTVMIAVSVVFLFKLSDPGKRPLYDTIDEISSSVSSAISSDQSSIIIKKGNSALRDNHSRGRSFNVLNEDASAIDE